MKKSFMAVLSAVVALVLAFNCFGVTAYTKDYDQTSEETDQQSDEEIIPVGVLGAYDLRPERTYGFADTPIDFEGFFGIKLSCSGKTVTGKLYTNCSLSKFDVNLIKCKTFFRDRTVRAFGEMGPKDVVTWSAKENTKEGIYALTVSCGDKITAYAYLYYDGETLSTCRVTEEAYDQSLAMSSWDELMGDVDPANYLSNAQITYPTSGTAGRCTHVDEFEDLSDSIVGNNNYSDEYKLLLFSKYITDNYAYDNFKINKLGGQSRAKTYDAWTDDDMFMFYNNVGVCWDFTNALVIMCRHHGIPATSVENEAHTMPAVYLDGEWVAVDITALIKHTCNSKDTDKSGWEDLKCGKYHDCYGIYAADMTDHDLDVWTIVTAANGGTSLH